MEEVVIITNTVSKFGSSDISHAQAYIFKLLEKIDIVVCYTFLGFDYSDCNFLKWFHLLEIDTTFVQN